MVLKTPMAASREPLAEEAREKNALFVGSIEKAICILYAFGEGRTELRLTEIAAITGLGRSAAQRYTHTFCNLGYLIKDPDAPLYRLAPMILDFSFLYLQSDPLVGAATPYLVEATKIHHETINLSRRQGQNMYFIVRVPGYGRRICPPSAMPGGHMPVFSTTAGRAILSCLPEDEARAVIERSDRAPLTPKTLTDPDAIMAQVRQTREVGFNIADEEGTLGVITIGAPILDRGGRPVAAVNMAAQRSSWTVADVRHKLGPQIVETAQTISRTQGYRQAYHES